MTNSIETFENYEILISKEKDTVFLPVIDPKVQLDHKSIQASVSNKVLKLTDGVTVLHFLDFSDAYRKLIYELGRICILDVTNPDDLKDFYVPVKYNN